MPNKTILVGGMIIISVGVIQAAIKKKPETPALVGGVAFLLLASLLDAIGGRVSVLATALVGLATVTVVMTESGAIITAIQNAQKNTQGKSL